MLTERKSLIVAVLLPCISMAAIAQTFSSGSTGADGALNYTTPGTYQFDPKSFTPPLNPSGDNVFNFTTINIAAGVTVVLSSRYLTGPVYWLASGAVTISGTLNLDGDVGHAATNISSERIPNFGGAGGYGGGVGGSATVPPSAGNGPGGGAAATARFGGPGTLQSNQFLVPMVGGSGGGGAITTGNCGTAIAGGGGAGGGAILIASSTSITLNQANIYARGGAGGCDGGAGSGGSIRLVAPSIIAPGGNSRLYVHSNANGGGGRVRLEAFSIAGYFDYYTSSPLTSVPFGLALPTTPPSSIKVTSINGVPVNANPFTFPDATISTNSAVNVSVQAQYIPVGTVPKIIVIGETGADQAINCTPLAGTLQQSTCTASVNFVLGGSRGVVKATW